MVLSFFKVYTSVIVLFELALMGYASLSILIDPLGFFHRVSCVFY